MSPSGAPLLDGIDDADDLRGAHFNRLMNSPRTWVLLLGVALVIAIAGGALISPVVGAGAFVVAMLAGVAIIFKLADERAAADFFEIYAEERGMSQIHGRGRLPERTPLLRRGNERYAERTLLGPLGKGVEGTLALYTFEEEGGAADGNGQTDYRRFTLALVEVPECRALVPRLYCERKSGFRALEGIEDALRGELERIELESEAFDRRYELFAPEWQDLRWLRRLFSPSFVVWMADGAPDAFGFELVDGNLCCYVDGHKASAEELDAVAATAATVAKRLREESAE